MKKIALHWQILIGLVLGGLFGLLFPNYVSYVSWMGDLFLRGLKMVIVPLILSSIICGMTSIGKAENFGRLGLKTMGYYVTTSLLAILTGLLMVNLLQPGVGAEMGFEQVPENMITNSEQFNGITTLLFNLVPTNIFDAFASGKMLSIIFFAVLFGYFILKVEDRHSNVLKGFFEATFEVMMRLTLFIIRLTPFGVFGILAKVTADALAKGTLIDIVGRLGWYSVTVFLALFIHACILLPLLLWLVGKINPLAHVKAMATPLLNAFGTASSSATLPLTMEAVEHKAGASNKVTSFTLPLGATINMDGTALYECVAAIFIAQAYGVELDLIQQLTVVFTALLASIGAAGIPSAGLVMMSVVLTAVGLPLEGVGLILAVDRILDMCRTMVNVWSDSCGAVIIAKSEGEVLTYAD